MAQLFRSLVPLVALTAAGWSGCDFFKTVPWNPEADALHPKETHSLTPLYGPNTGHVASGAIEGEALPQPIAFTHHRHTTVLGMDCQYCHTEARRSIHAGVPPVELCMGCHELVMTDSPEIQKVAAAWDAGETIPWAKVHDLPDYVMFNHGRHVQGGVDCTECHGMIPLEGNWARGEDPASVPVMKRETPLQMGWCLDCHKTHPSIEANYGDQADLRRMELKDCWTCHK